MSDWFEEPRRTNGGTKLIGYARVSTASQNSDRQVKDLIDSGVRRDDLYVDNGVSGSRASRKEFDRARAALEPGDTLVVTTLDRLGRRTVAMLELAAELRQLDIKLRVLNLGGQFVDTGTPMGYLMYTMMAGLAEMEGEIKRERNRDSVAKRRELGKSLGGRKRRVTDDQIRKAVTLIAAGNPAAEVARDMGMARATLYRRRADLGI